MNDALRTIDELIKGGAGELARKKLYRLAESKIPRVIAVLMASLARRAQIPDLGIRILSPIVRPQRGIPSQASIFEKSEYAACLVKEGAIDEALDILRALDGAKFHQVYYNLGSALVAKWEYGAAIPYFEKYIEAANKGSYQTWVGQLNLAAAFIFEKQNDRALAILEELRKQTNDSRFALLHGNTLDLLGQNELAQGHYEKAREWFELSAVTIKDSKGLYEFILRKWHAVLLALQTQGNAESIAEMVRVRAEAVDRNAWEIVRDLDRFRAIATGDTKLIVHLYFGTPFENFRNKLLEDFRNPVKIPDEYLWTLNGEKPTQLVFNLLKAEVEGKKFRLKSGQVIHRMLSILCSDFYRPFRVPGLFNSIFPGEHLNPRIAPSRIHQTVMRLRRWCKSSMFPLLIKENDGKYHLSASSPCSIRINRTEILGQGAKVVRLHIVKRALPKNEFSVHEVINILQVSRNSALRLLDEARKEGKVVRISGGPSTKYRFVA